MNLTRVPGPYRQPGGEVRVRQARPADVEGWVVLRQALWPAEPPDELAAEARTFSVDGDTLLEAVLLAEASDGTLLGFAELSLRPYAEDCRTSPAAHRALGFEDAGAIRCFRKDLQAAEDKS